MTDFGLNVIISRYASIVGKNNNEVIFLFYICLCGYNSNDAVLQGNEIMKQDYQDNYIGAGEEATLHFLKMLTGLPFCSLKEFPNRSGIYRQVPLQWAIQQKEFELLSKAHQKGSIDIFIILNQIKIAIRVQGSGHGEGLKGLGKSRHDSIQKQLIKNNNCQLVDIQKIECPEIFKDKNTNKAEQEVINSFKTAGVLIPHI